VTELGPESMGRTRLQQRHLVAGLRALILDGEVLPGEALPSSAELGSRYGVNAVSISRAMSILDAEGLVDRQKGRGCSPPAAGRLLSVRATIRIRLRASHTAGSAKPPNTGGEAARNYCASARHPRPEWPRPSSAFRSASLW